MFCMYTVYHTIWRPRSPQYGNISLLKVGVGGQIASPLLEAEPVAGGVQQPGVVVRALHASVKPQRLT